MRSKFVVALTFMAALGVNAAERDKQVGEVQSEREAARYERWKLKTSQAEARHPRTLRARSPETKAHEANVRGTDTRGSADRVADPGEQQVSEQNCNCNEKRQ